MQTGDLVIVSFPFSDLLNQKARPAVVVAETDDKYKDVIVCMISSVLPSSLSRFHILLKPSGQNNLRTTSFIKRDRIVTIEQNKILASIGRLDPEDFDKFRDTFKTLIDT